MDFEDKVGLAKRNTEEIISLDAFKELLHKKKKPRVYCGYEPSGGCILDILLQS